MPEIVIKFKPSPPSEASMSEQEIADKLSGFLLSGMSYCEDHGVAVLVIRKSDSSTLEPGEGVCIKEALIEVMMGRERNTFPLPPEQH